MTLLRLRLRLPDGSNKSELPPSLAGCDAAAVTGRAVLEAVSADWLAGAPVAHLSLLGGYPPRPVTELEAPLTSGNYVVRSSAPPEPEKPEKPAQPTFNLADHFSDASTAAAPAERAAERAGTLTASSLPSRLRVPAPVQRVQPGVLRAVVRKVPDDNSCLFSALAYLTAPAPGLRRDASTGDRLRMCVRDYILGDLAGSGLVDQSALDQCPTMSATLLGRPVREYAEWIADARHWGGEIELSILAPLLATEIAVLHAQPGTLIVYGRDQGHAARVHVIYDGLHYDPVALTIDTGGAGDFGEAEDVTVAFADDANAEAMMRNLCTEFHEARKFTDTAGFTLRCGQCGTGLVGEKGAVEHCEKTGHTSFQEYVDYS